MTRLISFQKSLALSITAWAFLLCCRWKQREGEWSGKAHCGHRRWSPPCCPRCWSCLLAVHEEIKVSCVGKIFLVHWHPPGENAMLHPAVISIIGKTYHPPQADPVCFQLIVISPTSGTRLGVWFHMCLITFLSQ